MKNFDWSKPAKTNLWSNFGKSSTDLNLGSFTKPYKSSKYLKNFDWNKAVDTNFGSNAATSSTPTSTTSYDKTKVGTYDGNKYVTRSGQVFYGDDAKINFEYDKKRYSNSPTVRESAVQYGLEKSGEKWNPVFEENNKKIASRKIKMGTRNSDGSYTSSSGRTFYGQDAKTNFRYDQLRSQGNLAEAAKFGRNAHKKKWDPIFEENNKKIATRKIKRGTRNADGTYTSADGTRTFKPGVHADANERYDELRASGQRNKAEEFGRKTHDAIARCKNTGYTSLIDIGGKTERVRCPSECCYNNGYGECCPMSEVVGTCSKTKRDQHGCLVATQQFVPTTDFSNWGCQLKETAKDIFACRKQKVNGKNKDWSAWGGGSCQSPESYRKIKACEKEGRGTYVGKKEQCRCKRGYVWPKVKKPEDHGCQTKKSAQKLEEEEKAAAGGSLGKDCSTNANVCDASTEKCNDGKCAPKTNLPSGYNGRCPENKFPTKNKNYPCAEKATADEVNHCENIGKVYHHNYYKLYGCQYQETINALNDCKKRGGKWSGGQCRNAALSSSPGKDNVLNIYCVPNSNTCVDHKTGVSYVADARGLYKDAAGVRYSLFKPQAANNVVPFNRPGGQTQPANNIRPGPHSSKPGNIPAGIKTPLGTTSLSSRMMGGLKGVNGGLTALSGFAGAMHGYHNPGSIDPRIEMMIQDNGGVVTEDIRRYAMGLSILQSADNIAVGGGSGAVCTAFAGVCSIIGTQIYANTVDAGVDRKIADLYIDPNGEKYPGYTGSRDGYIRSRDTERLLSRPMNIPLRL